MYRDDIFELASHAKKIDLRPVLGTNGILITRTVAQKIKDSGIDGLAISLDSTSPQYHDKLRGSTGSWDKAVYAVKYCVDVGLRVQINMTVTDGNFNQFERTADFALDLGAKALHPFFLIPAGRAKDIEEESLKKEKYFNALRTILESKKTFPLKSNQLVHLSLCRWQGKWISL